MKMFNITPLFFIITIGVVFLFLALPAEAQDPLYVSCSVSPSPASVGNKVTFNAQVSGGVGNYFYYWSGSCYGNGSSCETIFYSEGSQTAYLAVVSGNDAHSAFCSTSVSRLCDSNIYSACSDGDVYWYDSCGNRQGKRTECTSNVCLGNSCANFNDPYVYSYTPNASVAQDSSGSAVYGSCYTTPSSARVGETVTFRPSNANANYRYYWHGECIGAGSSCSTAFSQSGLHTIQLVTDTGFSSTVGFCSVSVGSNTTLLPTPAVSAQTQNSRYLACSGNAVYWFENGSRQSLYQDCNDGNSCTLDSCSNARCRNVTNCQNSSCAQQYSAVCSQSMTVKLLVKKERDSGGWTKEVEVSPGDKLEFLAVVASTGGQAIPGVNLKLVFPDSIRYLGSIKIEGVEKELEGDVVALGEIQSEETRTITFEAQAVRADQYPVDSLIKADILKSDTVVNSDLVKIILVSSSGNPRASVENFLNRLFQGGIWPLLLMAIVLFVIVYLFRRVILGKE